jgi:hypothetical protein
LTDPLSYDREQMDTIFLDHHDRKFWKLRAALSDRILPPFSSLSVAPRPFKLFMNVQLIPAGGLSRVIPCDPWLAPKTQISDQKPKIRNAFVHTLFTLVHANSRSFTLFFLRGRVPSAFLCVHSCQFVVSPAHTKTRVSFRRQNNPSSTNHRDFSSRELAEKCSAGPTQPSILTSNQGNNAYERHLRSHPRQMLNS